MKLFAKKQSRNEYCNTQIERSQSKFTYCKVAFNHVIKFKNIIEKYEKPEGPVICMGTRNGREVDLFRIIFKSNILLKYLVKYFEVNRNGWTSLIPFIESINRSNIDNIKNDSFFGVEINPEAKRSDVYVGSFDKLPEPWENSFSLLYSNSFDQSMDPQKTADEWIRILKNNGLILIGFNDAEPTLADPVGELSKSDFLKLFPGELLFYEELSSNYNDIIIRSKK